MKKRIMILLAVIWALALPFFLPGNASKKEALKAEIRKRIAPNPSDKKEALEAEVGKIVEEASIVHMRRNIAKFYELADIYAGEGADEQALGLYSLAFSADAANFPEQLKYAELLMRNGLTDVARDVLVNILTFVENQEVYEQAIKYSTTKPIGAELRDKDPVYRGDSFLEIIVYPVGNPSKVVLHELAEKLHSSLNMTVRVMDRPIALIEDGRSLELWPPSLKRNLATLAAGLDAPQDVRRFLTRTRMQYNNEVQLNNFIQEVRWRYEEEPNTVYLGITDEDIYDGDVNYVFGSTFVNYGIVSYRRFSADFTGEGENRQRLTTRLYKQALSSVNFMFGIPRCNASYCVRAYPHNLAEHDEKTLELCDLCRGRLDFLKNNPHMFDDFIDDGKPFIATAANTPPTTKVRMNSASLRYYAVAGVYLLVLGIIRAWLKRKPAPEREDS